MGHAYSCYKPLLWFMMKCDGILLKSGKVNNQIVSLVCGRDTHSNPYLVLLQKKPSWTVVAPCTRKSQEELLAWWFIPFSFVEDRGLSELIQKLLSDSPQDNLFHICCSLYVRKEVESKLRDVLQSKNKMSLTTDMLTSEANDSHLGLTYHILTADFELVSLCLAVEPFMGGGHTGVNIASCLNRDFTIDLTAVSAAVITDNASNMDLASRLDEWNSRHRFGHTLQLAINDWITMSLRIWKIKSAKTIVAFYNHSL